MRVTNASPYAVSYLTTWDRTGQEHLLVVVKCTFAFDRNGHVWTSDAQLPVSLVDEFAVEQPLSLQTPGDIHPDKPATDVLVQGSAHAPDGQPATEVRLELRVGPMALNGRVWGDRWLEHTLWGWRMTPAQPFLEVPLNWERSFGGRDPQRQEGPPWEQNPIGCGYRSDAPRSSEVIRAPNLEWLDSPYEGWKSRPRSFGLGPVHPAWESRRRYAGTYDRAWRERRAPLPPEDFDPRFFQCAPGYLQIDKPLDGGEPVVMAGFQPGLPIRFRLPRACHQVVVRGRKQPLHLDTLCLEPNHNRLWMVWRTCLAVGEDITDSGNVSILGKRLVPLRRGR